MKTMRVSRRKGFTIVELLIVIVVIAILAAISVVSYSNIQSRARDSIRKSDLAELKKALYLYNVDHGNYVEAGSGCGYQGNGYGWFNHSNGNPSSYPASVASCLTSGGYTSRDIADPTGGVSSSPTSGFTYMKYSCDTGTPAHRVYIYAKLETQPQSGTASDGTCNDSVDTLYGMNYFVQVK